MKHLPGLTYSAILSILILLLAASAPAQTVNTIAPTLKARIDRIATQILKQSGVPSASIAVVQHGRLVYTYAYGDARLAARSSPPVPATPAMRYPIGSISKQFTAAAILILQQEGKLSLDDPVGKYIPGLTGGDQVTIRQILSHTSGYQDFWPEDYVMPPMLKPVTSQYILDTWAKKPLDFAPGAQWQYSNTNYVIAGRIVEKITGEPLFTFLTQHVFSPLGMKSVWNCDQNPLPKTAPVGYYRHALGPLRPAPAVGRGWMFAAGELAMTPHDLALWDESLIARSLLEPQSYKEMFTAVKLKDGKNSHYGLGVQVLDRGGHLSIEHSGEVSGFVSDNEVLPEAGTAVAVLTNQDAVDAAISIARLAAPLIAGYPLAPAEQQALAIYRGLQHGRLDRTLLAPNLNAYLSPQAVAHFQSSLGPLGEPLSLRQTATQLRGGMTFREFQITYPNRRLILTTYTYPDGKLEQYLIAPAD